MSLVPLLLLRDRLSGNPDLLDFWQQNYDKPNAKHLIGYKQAPTANDYPSICYVPNAGLLRINKPDAVLASIVIGVHDEDDVDGVMVGIDRLFVAQDLIVAALTPISLGINWAIKTDEPIRTTTDLAVNHPFYQLEMHIPLKQL